MTGLILDGAGEQGGPLYRKLRDLLEDRIRAGGFPEGKLPSVRSTGTELGLSQEHGEPRLTA